ncbi:hypothetical protein PV721_10690 [Streptomyces sp. MB09-01]|uniref:hypothetical protein n=1 Tax=Streptomyces sp. MB09-01 TaxID=3028666 RepID=UPI0029A2E1C0|nr:hypothetical protein [Streptomyces sp. MB09-01]MDX3534831.1 hypothetical protein [Streptomyces sp. MB09-01]
MPVAGSKPPTHLRAARLTLAERCVVPLPWPVVGRLLEGEVKVEWYSPHPESRGDAERLAEAVVGLAFDGLRTAV